MTIEIIVPGSVDGGAGKVCEEVVLPLDAARGGDGGVSQFVALAVATPAPVKHVLRWPESAQSSNQTRLFQFFLDNVTLSGKVKNVTSQQPTDTLSDDFTVVEAILNRFMYSKAVTKGFCHNIRCHNNREVL